MRPPIFVIRLADGKPLAKLATMHRGDAQSYNHLTLHAAWSPDESWLIASSELKWHTDSASVLHIGQDSVSALFNPLPVCLDAERRGLKAAGKRVDFGKFEHSMYFKSVGNDGAVTAVCLMQIPKQDKDYTFLAQIKLSVSGKGVTASSAASSAARNCKAIAPCPIIRWSRPTTTTTPGGTACCARSPSHCW